MNFGFQPEADQPLLLAEPILDWRFKDPKLSRLCGKDGDSSFEAILSEVGIEGKSVIEWMVVNQGKARAVNKTKVFIIVSHENRLGRLFNRFANTKHFDPGLIKTLHEFDGGLVTDFGANERG